MKETLVSQLKAMKEPHNACTPDPTWKAKNKDRLFLHIENTKTVESTPTFSETISGLFQLFMPVRLLQAGQTVASVALISLVGIGSWIATVSASYNSVPGNVLYNVKLATEKVQIVVSEVTGEKKKTAKLHTEFAARRADEVKKVIETNKEPEQAKVAIVLMKKSITEATEAVQQVDTTEFTGTDVLEPTKALLEETDQIVQSLDESLEALPTDSEELLDDIIEAQGDLAEAQLDTIQNMVNKQLEGDASDEAEVVTIVKDVLETLNDRAEETEELTKGLQEETLAEEDTTVAEETSTEEEIATEEETATTSSTELVSEELVTSSTEEIDMNTSTVEALIPEAPEDQIDTEDVAAAEAVTKTFANAKSLVDSGRLSEAIVKAQEASDASTEVVQELKKAEIAVEESDAAEALAEKEETAVSTEESTDKPTEATTEETSETIEEVTEEETTNTTPQTEG